MKSQSVKRAAWQKLFGFACMMAIMSSAITSASGQSQTNDPKSCQSFVETFYKWYTSVNAKGDASDVALKQKASDFSPELLSQLKEDSAAQAKAVGELVGLDFDPFLATNDDPFESYVVGKVFPKGKNCWAEIYGVHDKKRSAKPVLWPEVAFNGKRWQFVNFHYVPDKISVNENLISILKVLKADRMKTK